MIQSEIDAKGEIGERRKERHDSERVMIQREIDAKLEIGER